MIDDMKYSHVQSIASLVMLCATAAASDQAELATKVKAALPAHVGACVLAIDGGQVVFEHAEGLADAQSQSPCTPDTNFRIASVSKQFTAATVMLLVDRGKISLDDTLTKFFPGFPDYGQKIKVSHLLTHTSGLPSYEDLIPKGTTLQLDDYDVLHLLMDTKEPRFEPGEKFEYSNSGYTLLGLIVEVAAREPFHEFMAAEVFKPLGMDNSVMYVRGLNSIPNRAYGHEEQNGKWVRSDQSLTSAVRGDGGVYTSLHDYLKWLGALDERKLLSPAAYKAIFSPQVATDRDGASYGYGWFLDEYRGERRVHHNGETHGFRACVQAFPDRHAAIVFQLNGEVAGDSKGLTNVGEKIADILIFDRK